MYLNPSIKVIVSYVKTKYLIEYVAYHRGEFIKSISLRKCIKWKCIKISNINVFQPFKSKKMEGTLE